MIKLIHDSVWLPNYVADSILDIDVQILRVLDITHLVFDLDKTLVFHHSNILSHEYVQHIAALRKEGFQIFLGSNTRREIIDITDLLGIEAVRAKGMSIKPFASFYKRIISATDTTPDHIAMVGDHFLNDVFGANRAGLTTIMVKALRHRKPSPINAIYIKYALKYKNKSN